jgi:hypothetical protein
MHRPEKDEARQTVAAAPGLREKALEQAARILAEVGQRGNLAALGPWASKAALVEATGRSRDWLERAAAAGLIERRLEVDHVARRVRSMYRTADVQRLLEAAP